MSDTRPGIEKIRTALLAGAGPSIEEIKTALREGAGPLTQQYAADVIDQLQQRVADLEKLLRGVEREKASTAQAFET